MVDSVFTAGPLEPAAATASFGGANVRFTFSIPRGQDGAQGLQGTNGFDGQPGMQVMQGIQGDNGPVGPVGPPFTSFVIDGVTTLPPWQPATVQAVFDGTSVRLSFGIPQGQQGNNGMDGQPGQPGMQGPPRPAFTSFVVEAVNTLEPWQPAAVTTSFDGTNVRFTFGIPRGNDGMPGAPGAPGPSDLSGTSSNSNGVAALGLAVSDPPTQAELQAVVAKVDELIAALRRV